ncbi:MAG: 23S rRNA (guanosine(2251)-2'-O)-methyltransferase RlmB [Bacilli bacterium]|nr:23S rRNA (guanosine(2251)-2'-O)-methyltransferase RlmB [Bacilli bacterium]
MASLIYGRNSVIAALTSSRVVKIYVNDTFKDKRILSLSNQKQIPLFRMNAGKLSELVHNHNHQGVVAEVKDYQYYDLSTLIDDGKKINNPIIIMLDGITDPHNLGAILRIADAFNAIGIVIRKTSQVPLNATVDKVSTGAINYVKVATVSNLNVAIKKLKDAGYWIVATDGEGKDNYASLDYRMPIVLIIGSEADGISSLVKSNSDFVVKIPMYGHVNSLNASNALSVILSHITNLKNSPK